MRPYACCVVVKPCTTDGVLKLLPGQQHIRSSPACSLLTRRMCICKRWVRMMTAREPPHTDLTVTCFAQPQYHLAVSHLVVLHRYQPLVPPVISLTLRQQVSAVRLAELGLGRRVRKLLHELLLWPPGKIVKSCVQVQSFNIIQFPSCMRESRREGTLKVSGHASQPHSGSPPIDIPHVRAVRPYTSLFCRSPTS
jgi:hypothetical protein